MNIYTFSPTWLMIKRHKVTGLLYFCKTSKFDPIKYLGSGKYWRAHLKIHGKLVDTIWMKEFSDLDDIVDFATLFSELFNIVNAKDKHGNKIWANLEIENGISGMPIGTDRGKEFKEKCKINNKGSKNPSYGSFWINDGVINKKIKEEIPAGWNKGRIFSETQKEKMLNRDLNGSKNPRYISDVYIFKNIVTEEIVTSTRYEFAKNILKTKSLGGKLSNLIKGKRKTIKKWICVGPV